MIKPAAYLSIPIALLLYSGLTNELSAQDPGTPPEGKYYFIDVHDLGPGNVKAEDVAGAHQKDLETQDKYDVKFIKYFVDEENGKIYCLSEAADSQSVASTHAEAHGLVPVRVYKVSPGSETPTAGEKKFFLDTHHLEGVTKEAVAEAHQKDLATQDKYGVNFFGYWVDEETGTVWCVSEAESADQVRASHKEAHGLVPDDVEEIIIGE